jgi:hypothetical protein
MTVVETMDSFGSSVQETVGGTELWLTEKAFLIRDGELTAAELA